MILSLIKNSDASFRKHLSFFLVTYFLTLLNYPLVRASSSTLFFENIGAESSPVAWLWGVLFLTVAIYICNRLQMKLSVQRVYFLASLFSSFLFLGSTLGITHGHKLWAYIPFIWKEIYIVIQIHLLLAYANNHFKKTDFKILIGLIGGVGSLGGILGGAVTSYLSSLGGTQVVMYFGLCLVLLPAFFFLATPVIQKESSPTIRAPVSTLTGDLKKYVALIAGIVALSQFIINIADFNFNLAFVSDVLDSNARTHYLGRVYMVTHFLTFIFQFLFLPWLLPRVTEQNYHLFIPASYLAGLGILYFTGLGGLLPVAVLYIFFKASDYSFFSAGKEILYQPLENSQKYGAKYLTDMLVYRAAKALIAAVLIYLQTSLILNMMMVIFLCLWVILIVKLFQLHRQLFS